jgi:hypothetical protein
MPEVRQVGDLAINQDLVYQRREWLFERVGWGALTLVIVLALLGVFGGGPLSSTAAATQDDSLRVEYERFLRLGARALLHVEVTAASGGEVRLWLDRAYLDGFRINEVRPAPLRTEATPERFVFVFRAGREQGPIQILFLLEAERIGRRAGRLGVGNEAITISHFIYP